MRAPRTFYGVLPFFARQSECGAALGAISENIVFVVSVAALCFSRRISAEKPLHSTADLQIFLVLAAALIDISRHRAEKHPEKQRIGQYAEDQANDRGGNSLVKYCLHNKADYHQHKDQHKAKLIKLVCSVSAVEKTV